MKKANSFKQIITLGNYSETKHHGADITFRGGVVKHYLRVNINTYPW